MRGGCAWLLGLLLLISGCTSEPPGPTAEDPAVLVASDVPTFAALRNSPTRPPLDSCLHVVADGGSLARRDFRGQWDVGTVEVQSSTWRLTEPVVLGEVLRRPAEQVQRCLVQKVHDLLRAQIGQAGVAVREVTHTGADWRLACHVEVGDVVTEAFYALEVRAVGSRLVTLQTTAISTPLPTALSKRLLAALVTRATL